VKVVAKLLSNIVHAAVVALVDLGPSRDAGANALPERVSVDLFAQRREQHWLFGPRANDIHVADEDVIQLRQLIQAVPPQNGADTSDAIIVFPRPDLRRT